MRVYPVSVLSVESLELETAFLVCTYIFSSLYLGHDFYQGQWMKVKVTGTKSIFVCPNFECLDLQTTCLVCRYIITTFRSRSSIKVIVKVKVI